MIIWPADTLERDTVTAILNGFVIGAEDDHGTRFTLAQSDGWYGSPGMRDLGPVRPSQHGAFPVKGLKTGRSIAMTGLGLADSQAAGSRSIRDFGAVLADGDFGALTFLDEDDTVLSALVQRDSDVKIQWFSNTAFRYQVALFAPDPRLYGTPVTDTAGLPGGGTGLILPLGAFFDFGDPGSLAQVTLTNDGNAPTEPLLTITGPLASGFQVTQTETGRRLVYPYPVSTDVVIDCSEGTAASGGQDRSGLLTVDEFFIVGPGQSSTFQFSTLGAETVADPASLTVTLSPAYH